MKPTPEYKPFYLIWSPEGKTPPTMRHETLEEASTEALRLAKAHPRRKFYVLQSRGGIRVREDMTFSPDTARDIQLMDKANKFPEYLCPLKPEAVKKWLEETIEQLSAANMPWGFWPKFMTDVPAPKPELPTFKSESKLHKAERAEVEKLMTELLDKTGHTAITLGGGDKPNKTVHRPKNGLPPYGKKVVDEVKRLVEEGRCMAVHYADHFTVYGINALNLPEGACVDEIVKGIKLEDPQAIIMVFGKNMDARVYPADDLEAFLRSMPKNRGLLNGTPEANAQPETMKLHPLVEAVQEIIDLEREQGFDNQKGVIVLSGKAEEYGCEPQARGVKVCGRSIMFAGDIKTPAQRLSDQANRFNNWQG